MKLNYINKNYCFKKAMKVIKVATGLIIIMVMFISCVRGPKGITYKPVKKGIVVEYGNEKGLKTDYRKKKVISLEEVEDLIREYKEKRIKIEEYNDDFVLDVEFYKNSPIGIEFNKQKKLEFKTKSSF